MFYLTATKTLVIIYSFFFIYNVGLSHNIDYSENIILRENPLDKNIVYNVEKAKLLKNYVDGLQKEISDFSRDHYVKNESLESKSFELKIMSESLRKTQTLDIEKHHAESVYNSIIEKIKTLKTEISEILKKEHTASSIELARTKNERSEKAKVVSNKFSNFVAVFTPRVRALKASEKRSLILSSITVINIEASKLALFGTRNFSSQRQMDEYYSNSLRTIKRELQKIQATILKK